MPELQDPILSKLVMARSIVKAANICNDETMGIDIISVEVAQVVQPDSVPVMLNHNQISELEQPVSPGTPTAMTSTDESLPCSPQMEERPIPPPRTVLW